MAIVTSEIIEQTLQASGAFRVKFKYTFEDGREYFIGYLSVTTEPEIALLLISKKDVVELNVRKEDALEAVSLGLEVAHKTATLVDVYKAYLIDGYFNEDPIESYLSMNIVAQKVIDLGLTIQEVADLFEVPVEDMQKAVDKWAYLDTNKATLAAYQVVKDGI